MKSPHMNKIYLLGLATLLLHSSSARSATTRIGNGDEGSDLEGFTAITSGAIFDSRAEAVTLLKSLNVKGIAGLGQLLPEVEDTKLYITKKDSSAVQNSDQNQFHADMKGRVYARTFAEPHAVTRFFPVAEKLDHDQLVALNIHEGLHRSLPADIRENESIVSEITLAITAPGANADGIRNVVRKFLPETTSTSFSAEPPGIPMSDTSRAKNPSVFGYEYRSYRNLADNKSFTINSMHIIETELYPFSIGQSPFGLGIKFSFVERPNTSYMGPLDLSGKIRIWTYRGFDVGTFIEASLNSLSNQELKQSQFGRDAFKVGVSVKRDLNYFSIENFLSYMFAGNSVERVGNIDYTYSYGSVVTASTHPALLLGPLRLGGFFEFMLGDHYRVSGGAFSYDPGRYRLVSIGPELQLRIQNVVLGVSGRFLLDHTKDASFDSLGDLMGSGVAQGSISGQISIFF
jgi:hypothetical protein